MFGFPLKHLSLMLSVAGLVGCSAAPALSSAATKLDPAPAVPALPHPAKETPQWWFRSGAAAAQRNGAGQGQAPKNVIVFLGDGMGLSTIAAARILEGQRAGQSGEERRLAFEEFPHTALSRTYNVNAQTPDSAGTMTAIMSGVKARMGSIGINPLAPRGSCAAAAGNETVSLLQLAASAGMGTGIVTTTRITHATPAATYGHATDRDWESDADLPAHAVTESCADLARQLIEFPAGGGLNVALGGGRERFLPEGVADPADATQFGLRRDGRDLTAEWAARAGSSYVWNPQQLAQLDPKRSEHVLGLFAASHLDYDVDRRNNGKAQPSLAEMTTAAISLLQKRGRGYFLMVEGGRIDMGHHAGNAYRALDDTLAFSDAVRVADQLTAEDDTLILVTADHSHVFSMGGYSARGNPILGLTRRSNPDEGGAPIVSRDLDGKPYTTLSYASGPGFTAGSDKQADGVKHFPHLPKAASMRGPRPDLDHVDTTEPGYMQEALVPLRSETHGGEDVAVFARGPGASAVRGSLEQNVLFHLIAQAQPQIRDQLCKLGVCNADGVPVELPSHRRWLENAASTAQSN